MSAEEQGFLEDQINAPDTQGDPQDYNFPAATSRVTIGPIPAGTRRRFEVSGEWVMFPPNVNFILAGSDVYIHFDDSPGLPVMFYGEFIRVYPFRYIEIENANTAGTTLPFGPVTMIVGRGRALFFEGAFGP